MNITIPNILAGEAGRQMQAAGDAALASANARARTIGAIVGKNVKAETDQQNLIEGQRLENEMVVEKQKAHEEMLRGADGTDPTVAQKLKEKDEEIGQAYIAKGSNNEVKNYLSRTHMTSQHTGMLQATKMLEEKLFNTSINTTKIKTDDEIRSASQTGEYGTGLINTTNYIEAQRPYFGANTDSLKTAEVQRYTENYLKLSLSNPITAPVLVQRLADPTEKSKIFANLDANKIDEVERLLQSAGKDAIRQNAYNKLFEDFGGKFENMSVAIDDPKNMKKYGLTLEDAQYLKGSFARNIAANREAQELEWDKTAKEVFLNLNKYSPSKINRLVADGRLSYQLGDHFKNELKQAGTGGASDPMTYYGLYTEVKSAAGDPEAIRAVRQKIFGTGGLSFSDKKSMLAMTENEEDKHEAQITKSGADYIKNVVMPSQTMLSAAKPKEAENYLDAMKTFNEAIIAAKKRGEKINGETINTIAKEVAATYSMTVYEQMDAARKKMLADKQKAQRSAKTKPENAVKDKYGYIPGVSTKVIKGKTYTYIGNDQWQ